MFLHEEQITPVVFRLGLQQSSQSVAIAQWKFKKIEGEKTDWVESGISLLLEQV